MLAVERFVSAQRGLGAVIASLALAVAGCGGSSTLSASPAPPASTGTSEGTTAAQPSPVRSSSEPGHASLGPSPTPEVLPQLKLLWQKAGPAQKAPGTYWPTIDPATGEVWVASPWDNKYWIFDQNGTYLRSWGTPGSGDGQLNLLTHDPSPDGVGAIAFEPDGTFYVADNGNYRVEKFDRNGRFLLKWGSFGTGDGQFVSAKGIYVHGDVVSVEDDPRNDLQEFDRSGRYLRKIDGVPPLFGMDRSGNFWFGNDDPPSIIEVDPTGQQVARFVIPPDVIDGGGPGETTVDAHGDVFGIVAFRQDPANPFLLIEFDRSGTLVHRWSVPHDVETADVSPDGKSIYFAYLGPDGNWPYLRKYAIP